MECWGGFVVHMRVLKALLAVVLILGLLVFLGDRLVPQRQARDALGQMKLGRLLPQEA